MMRKPIFGLAVALFVTTLAATGYWMLFSSFALWDDEGYILISAREYFSQGGLYEKVYSQYGPAFYVLLDLIQHISGPIDHNSARLLTLALWLGTAACCSLMVWRWTTSRSLVLFTLTASFFHLHSITDEPFHPGSLIFFTLAVSLYAMTSLIAAGRINFAIAIAGITGTALILTKINVGAFFVTAITCWAVVNSVSEKMRKNAGFLVITLSISLALTLMHTLLRESWVQIYLVVFASGIVSLTLAKDGESLIQSTHMKWFLGAGACSGLVILTTIWLRGTSSAGLLDGVLLGPLRHPGNYSYPVDWRPGTIWLAAISLGLAIAHPSISRNFSPEIMERVMVSLRMLFGLGLLIGFALMIDFRSVGTIFSYVAPLAWIWVIPLKSLQVKSSERVCRGLLAFVLLIQYLHAYPVGGSQESWGTFLFIPLVALGLGDVRRWLIQRQDSVRRCWRPWAMLALTITIVVTAKAGRTALVARNVYARNAPLNLPGATWLHLSEPQGAAYRILALNAAIHTDMLFSLPGMFSFNLWTGLPTPTPKNTTLWFTLLNDSEQNAIIRTLEQTPRAGLIVQRSLVGLMLFNQIPMHGLLWDYLHQNFNVAFKTEEFAFCVRKGRQVVPFNLAAITHLASPNPQAPSYDTQLEFCIVQDGSPIAAMAINAGTFHPGNSQILDATNSVIASGPITRAGQMYAPSATTSWPLTGKGPVHVLVRFNAGGITLQPSTTILHLKGTKGEALGEMRIAE